MSTRFASRGRLCYFREHNTMDWDEHWAYRIHPGLYQAPAQLGFLSFLADYLPRNGPILEAALGLSSTNCAYSALIAAGSTMPQKPLRRSAASCLTCLSPPEMYLHLMPRTVTTPHTFHWEWSNTANRVQNHFWRRHIGYLPKTALPSSRCRSSTAFGDSRLRADYFLRLPASMRHSTNMRSQQKNLQASSRQRGSESSNKEVTTP